MNNTDGETVEAQQDLIRIVDELLLERQQVLLGLCKISELDLTTSADERQGLLQQFCEVLMDYSALWHFEVLDYLKQHKDEYPNALDAAVLHEERIVQASERAVAFNDKYDAATHDLCFDQLDSDLSKLGEEIAARVESEDKILNAMIVG